MWSGVPNVPTIAKTLMLETKPGGCRPDCAQGGASQITRCARDVVPRLLCPSARTHWLTSLAEFRTFVEQAERQLLVLFKNIDKDGNGKLDMKELQAAFKNARLTVSSGRLSDFFNDMDMNNDGYVSFDEWR